MKLVLFSFIFILTLPHMHLLSTSFTTVLLHSEFLSEREHFRIGWENIVGFDIDRDSILRWMSHLQFFIPALHFCHIISVTSRPGKPDRSSWFALIAVRTSSHCAAFHSSVPVSKCASVKVWGWMGLRKVKKELMVNSLTHYTAQRYTGFQY